MMIKMIICNRKMIIFCHSPSEEFLFTKLYEHIDILGQLRICKYVLYKRSFLVRCLFNCH